MSLNNMDHSAVNMQQLSGLLYHEIALLRFMYISFNSDSELYESTNRLLWQLWQFAVCIGMWNGLHKLNVIR